MPAPYKLWSQVGNRFGQNSLDQLTNACTLPVAVTVHLPAPLAGAALDLPHEARHRQVGAVLDQNMEVIDGAVDLIQSASQVADNAADEGVQPHFHFRSDERPAVLGGGDDVRIELGE